MISMIRRTSTKIVRGVGGAALLQLQLLLLVCASQLVSFPRLAHAVEYGVDVSFPIHYDKVVPSADNPLGDRKAVYDDFLTGCKDFYGKKGKACQQTEDDRIAMSLRQPQSMANYTDMGFKKMKAPANVYALLKDFWKVNQHNQKKESWPAGNTYTNHWKQQTWMVSVEDTKLRGGGFQLKQKIWNAAQTSIQEWTGEELTQCSLYGIRVYKEGAILATHVDRLPLVSSAIINVAQDVDEPWPIEVYGHDGKAYNITMEPGDMVLYESHSVLHGRPFPLKGRFFANVFIHFEPTGHSLRHNAKQHALESGGDVNARYKKAADKGTSGHEADHDGLPSYLIPGTPEEKNWRRQHPNGDKKKKPRSFATGSHVELFDAAKDGDVETLEQLLKKDAKLVAKKDENGWTPVHEVARGGHIDALKLLVEKGADINERANFGYGGTALYLAKEAMDENEDGSDVFTELIEYLEGLGAEMIGPEL